MSDQHKQIVRRLVSEVLNGGRLDVFKELYAPELVEEATDWIAPFRASFPDTRMEIIELIAEGDTVAARFICSATHLGDWIGDPPTGRRFERVDEVSIYRFANGRIVASWGIEDNLCRREQLGLR
jgi:ketosteroid isomerase-like protein